MMEIELQYIKTSHPLYKKWTAWKLSSHLDKLVCKEWQKDRCAFFKWAFSQGWNRSCRILRNNKKEPYSPSNSVLKWF